MPGINNKQNIEEGIELYWKHNRTDQKNNNQKSNTGGRE